MSIHLQMSLCNWNSKSAFLVASRIDPIIDEITFQHVQNETLKRWFLSVTKTWQFIDQRKDESNTKAVFWSFSIFSCRRSTQNLPPLFSAISNKYLRFVIQHNHVIFSTKSSLIDLFSNNVNSCEETNRKNCWISHFCFAVNLVEFVSQTVHLLLLLCCFVFTRFVFSSDFPFFFVSFHSLLLFCSFIFDSKESTCPWIDWLVLKTREPTEVDSHSTAREYTIHSYSFAQHFWFGRQRTNTSVQYSFFDSRGGQKHFVCRSSLLCISIVINIGIYRTVYQNRITAIKRKKS